MRIWFSFSIALGVNPEETAPWKPDKAPHAMVMNRNGNRLPENVGPLERDASVVSAGTCTCGFAMTTPMTSRASVPIFMRVDR